MTSGFNQMPIKPNKSPIEASPAKRYTVEEKDQYLVA
jgi:hypothetical protein